MSLSTQNIAYLGCVSLPAMSTLIAGIDPQGCTEYCMQNRDTTGPYAYFAVTGFQTANQAYECLCSPNGPDAATYTNADGWAQCSQDYSDEASTAYSAWILSTFGKVGYANGEFYNADYSPQACYTEAPTGSALLYQGISSPHEAFQHCIDYVYTAILPNGGSFIYACSDALDTIVSGEAQPCGANTYYSYQHQQGSTTGAQDPAGSPYVKRQQRKRSRDAQLLLAAPCAKGQTACLIDKYDKEAYECVDTFSDLESCGGCVIGEYGRQNVTSTGVDCSSTVGVALSGTMCIGGQCDIFACRRGFTMLKGACVPDSVKPKQRDVKHKAAKRSFW